MAGDGDPVAAEPSPARSAPRAGARPEPRGTEPSLTAQLSRPPEPGERFSGRGSIRGRILLAGGGPTPAAWTLEVLPSFTLVGREFAEHRTLTFEAGETEFAVRDLPFGGYDLVASAPSANGLRHPVLLERGSASPYVTIMMVPAGTLEGRLVDHVGAPAEGVPVTLLTLATRATREALSDPLGRFRFEEVLDGAYELIVGRYENPVLAERTKLRFSAPSMTLPDVELPALARLELLLVDIEGRPLGDAVVRGRGDQGGTVDGHTDAQGKLSVGFLPPGRYRLRFSLDGYETRRNTLPVELDGENAYRIELFQP